MMPKRFGATIQTHKQGCGLIDQATIARRDRENERTSMEFITVLLQNGREGLSGDGGISSFTCSAGTRR
jgi:hypothetical protein